MTGEDYPGAGLNLAKKFTKVGWFRSWGAAGWILSILVILSKNLSRSSRRESWARTGSGWMAPVADLGDRPTAVSA